MDLTMPVLRASLRLLNNLVTTTKPLAKALRFFACLAALLMCAAQTQAAGNAPSAPLNLSGTLQNGLVTLTWDASVDDDSVQGYNVYVNNQYNNTVTTNSYSAQLQANTLYSFYVVAFDEVPRNFSAASQSLSLPESLVPTDLTIPPSTPTSLSGTLIDGTVTLSWQPSTDDEAVQGYNVYRDNQYLTTVTAPTFTDVNNGDSSHAWYVVAFDVRTNFSARSDRITVPDLGPVDTTIAPSVPTGLQGSVAAGAGGDTVSINWSPSSDDQLVAGYNTYQNRQYIATRFTTQYQTQVSAGSSNEFAIVAFDFDGNFSATSDSLTLPLGTEETDPRTPPSVPTQLQGDTTTSGGQTQVQLTWQASTGPVSVAGYNVYRNNNYLTTVFSTQYSDTVTAGVAFSYSIVAFDSFGNFSSRSNPLSLLGDNNQPPFFTGLSNQQLSVGEQWELRLRPVDLDGGAAGILINNQPAGASLIDNQDGSQTLVWQPTVGDVGSYDVTIIAFDLADVSLRTSQTITLTVSDDNPTNNASFNVSLAQAAYNLQEGDENGISIPISVTRTGNSTSPITLSVDTNNTDDSRGIATSFSTQTLGATDNESVLNIQLSVGVLPILPQQRSFVISATDGTDTRTSSITVAVTPVALDDVYLIIGQSNMEGFSEFGAKQDGPGEADEPNLRIRQANVERNNFIFYTDAADYTDVAVNFGTPAIVTAEDPLHEPVHPLTFSKEGTRIGLSMMFARSARSDTSRNIVLVPAAWSGTGFCDRSGAQAQWNSAPNNNPELGNTLLFDRAVARTNETLRLTGGILRGILWHQGESDSVSRCAPFYQDNLAAMVAALRSTINADARGAQARGSQANIPFVVGTMSRGNDNRGNFAVFDDAKTSIDNVHQNIASVVPFSDVSLHDDLIPSNGYPCGEGSCIHFGASALREMGSRYYESLLRAVDR